MTVQLTAAIPSNTVVGVDIRSFRGAQGGCEHFITIDAPADMDFSGQVKVIEARYAQALLMLGLDADTAIFRRIFLSDSVNQIALLQDRELVCDADVAVSVIQQPPLTGAKIAMLAYHLDDRAPIAKRRLSPKHLLVEKSGNRHLWTTRLCAGGKVGQAEAENQTREVFDNLVSALGDQGGSLRDHCVRTWIYVKDVDVFYQDVVKSRTELFLEQGLTADTHYISSTGIEGACAHQFDVVVLDAYSALDLSPRQMSFLNDFDHMCPTQDYNVTFERGTRIAYNDRAHHFISGTASIDNAGNVLHLGDVIAQLDRALINVDAILKSGQSSLDDMMYWIVYLRDPSDYAKVKAHLDDRFPDVPTMIVRGPVCRPEWLIEIEGIAVAPMDEPSLPSF